MFFCVGLLILTYTGFSQHLANDISTYSIVAYDSVAEEWGVAVQSKFLAVGAVVPYARADIGAVASQAWGNPNFGSQALDLMSQGVTADSALKVILSADSSREYRQVGIVDRHGRAATYTGEKCQPWAGGITGDNFCVQGNILAGDSVIIGMAGSFREAQGTLARRLLKALYGGQRYGGDRRGMQSAALLVVSEKGGYSGYNDRMIDLRVDDAADPLGELERLLSLHERTFGAGAYSRLGMEALKEGKKKKGELLLIRAREMAERYDDALILNQIAWEYAINDFRLQDALRMAEKAASLLPDNADILDTWAECLARLGNFKKAVEIEKKAWQISRNFEFREKIKRWKRGMR